jgi:putative transposase
MIDRDHALPVTQQARLVGISRSSAYYQSRGVSEADLKLMRRIDELHLEHPFAGARMLHGCCVAKASRSGADTSAP